MEISNINSEFIKEFLTDLLKLGPNNLIGLDIGTSAIKMCELIEVKKGQYKIENFSYKLLPEGSIIEDDILKPVELVNSIIECFEELKVKNINISVGIGGNNTVIKRLAISGGTEKEIADEVEWESEQYIPFGADNATVSHHILGKNVGGGVDVLIAAANNQITENIMSLITEARLKTKVVDLKIFALANVFQILKEMKFTKDISYLLLDFGAQTTTIIIIKEKEIIFSREIAMGGMSITEEIQKQLGLSFNEAENLKTRGDGEGNYPEEIMQIIELNLDPFVNEIKKTVNFFQTTTSDLILDSCYLTGGNAKIPGLKRNLETELSIPIYDINIFQSFSFNKKNITEEKIEYINQCGMVSMGLSMRLLREK
jgi:type IV pilus assembly protein PilM